MAQVEKIEKMPLKPLLLTIAQAGELLGVKRAKAYEMAAEGLIPTVSLGERSTRVPLEALEKMVRQMAAAPQDGADAPPGPLLRVK